LSLALLLGVAVPSLALDLKAWDWPLAEKSYEPIDAGSVRTESWAPTAQWQDQVRSKNALLADDLIVVSVATIEVTRRDLDQDVPSFEPFMEKGLQSAARLGANVLYVEKPLMEGDKFLGLRLTAYRIEYKGLVVSPPYLAVLPYDTVSRSEMERNLQAWDAVHLGRSRTSFETENGKISPEKVVSYLGKVKNGTPVRVLLRDGSDYKGTYDGLDDDDQIWIQPDGWLGRITDRSFQAKDVQAVGLLN